MPSANHAMPSAMPTTCSASLSDIVFRWSIARVLNVMLAIALSAWAGLAPNVSQAQSAAGKKYALLVGVNSYPSGSGLASLSFPDRDVEELAKVLIGSGYPEKNVRVLSDARGRQNRTYDPLSGNLHREFRLLLTDKQPDDVLLIALSGHGIMRSVEREIEGRKVLRQETFFCPVDADLTGALPNTLISLDVLYEQLADCPAKVKILLCDACRNRTFDGPKTSEIELPPPLPPPRTVAALYSCAKEELSFEDDKLAGGHGVFLHFVVEGLKGAADANRDGQVTLTELAEFSQDKVRAHVAERFGRRQMPELLGSLHRVPLLSVARPDAPLPPGPPTPPVGAVAEVTSATANVMSGADVVKTVRKGDKLPALKRNGPWVGVALTAGGTSVGGWIQQDSVRVIGSIPQEAASSSTSSSSGTSSSVGRFEGTRAGEVREFGELKIPFCWCPPGTFQMGSPASDTEALDWEKPQVNVTLSRGFWLGQTEVTQAQWKSVTGTEPWKGKTNAREGATYPATHVSWDEAVEYCRKLTERERAAGRLTAGQSYRLPTEAEREYACRAGTTTKYHFGDDAGRLGDYAWFYENAYDANERYAHTVATKRANPWNLHDMHGNVWEWCQDVFVDKLVGNRDPLVSSGGAARVYRGGGWVNTAGGCRSASRSRVDPSNRNDNLGFRAALSPFGQ